MPPSALSQTFPPAPTFLPKNLTSLTGKVFIVTGAASGVGYELAKILYTAGGSVYIGARSSTRCLDAIENIKAAVAAEGAGRDNGKKGNRAGGKLSSLVIDLADLSTVKNAAVNFLAVETRLDSLIHNAGVMQPPAGSKDKQGNDLEIGVHCLGPYLFTQLLEPLLCKTAESASPFSVRVVFVVSLMEAYSQEGGMTFTHDGVPLVLSGAMNNYMQSKVGESWVAAEFAKRLGDRNILSLTLHPGFMRTELQRHLSFVFRFMMKIMFKPAEYGAYSELFAALSPTLGKENNGGHIVPWGRIGMVQKDVASGLKDTSEGGSGNAAVFIKYCNRAVEAFL